MPSSGSALWSFFIVVVLTLTILLVAVGATMVLSRRRLLELHREYTRGLVRAQDEERKAIAAEVHDELTQRVSALRIGLSMIRGRLAAPATDLGALEKVEEELGDLSGSMRDLASRIHPKGVDDAGLANALASLAEELRQEFQLTVHLVHQGGVLPIGPRGYAIYRIVHEALRNAARHGGAREAWVTTRYDDGSVLVEIEDRGAGFDPEAPRPPGRGGLGLLTMGERAMLVGGSVAVESQPGRGALVRVRIPEAEVPAHA